MNPRNKPFNIELMDVEKFIDKHDVQEVTSAFVRESSTNNFHPEGLFSERIFGEVASAERFAKFGYVDLKMTVFHPRVYKAIIRLKRFYEQVIAGRAYAIYDKETKDLIPSSDPEVSETGFAFFVRMLPKLQFDAGDSLFRNSRIEILEKYKKLLLVDKWIVCPAGVRDFKVEDGRQSTDDINKYYQSLINYSKSIPNTGWDNSIYDSIRYSIQRKINEIDVYITNLLEGKTGFLQRKLGARNVALATGNVISGASMIAESPLDDAPTNRHPYHHFDYTKIPLYQAMKGFQPAVIHSLKNMFFERIFSAEADQIPLIDPKTRILAYHEVEEIVKDKYLSTDGLGSMINNYEDIHTRTRPVTVLCADGIERYIYMVYDIPSTTPKVSDTIFFYRDETGFIDQLKSAGMGFVKEWSRPITYAEMMYHSTLVATYGKHAIITRYPVTHVGSTYITKVHLTSTSPSRIVRLAFFKQEEAAMMAIVKHAVGDDKTVLMEDTKTSLMYFLAKEYPVLTAKSIDSLILHPSRLGQKRGLGGDHDGDTVSCVPVLSDEANKECNDYLNSPANCVSPNGVLATGGDTDLISMTLHNLSVDPPPGVGR